MRSVLLLLWGLGCIAAEYTVDPSGSNAYFKASARVLFVGSDEIVGINDAVSGTIREAGTGGEISIDACAFQTQNARRDRHLRQILRCDVHPRITFRFQESEGALRGALRVNGIEQAIVVPVHREQAGDALVYEGKLSVRYADFGITPPTLGGGVIKQAREQIEIGARITARP